MKILLGCLMAMLLTACSGNRVVNYDVGEKPDDFPVLKAVGYAVIDIQPGPNTVVPSLNPERNCVTAVIWKQSEGPKASRPVPWCFNAA